MHVDKNRILEIAFETIKDSTDWCYGCDGKNYNYWITGVVQMTDRLLEDFNKKNCNINAD